ncbi:autotransporter-associated beta strand repeat-containing protein [Coraliomargarita algicola]|uniref:Autotransporter-associated beta strand repeat-containing protein n=1 Tax=Coraliomargarita algicola TaxID=3092156 RepID=A0ABZ0RUW9_9BACT|nr:PEP-CTERM sorting domain-containing protein [Coraliomargarita sp. J2-16]WPJ96754.1 autotransporter-associated beta strand repeat-containing protein [Coraliomargarita sp. J2-16]
MKNTPQTYLGLRTTSGYILSAVTVSLITSLSAHADVISWDGDTSVTWTDGDNWSGGVAPADSLLTDIARFDVGSYGGSTYAPNVGTTSVYGIQIGSANGNFTMDGATLSLGGGGIVQDSGADFTYISVATLDVGDRAQAWTNNAANNLTINSQISGSADLTFDGAGSVTLANSSSGTTYTGNVVVSQGRLDVTGGAFGADNDVSLASGAVLGLGNPGVTLGGLNDYAGGGGTVGMIVNNNRPITLAGDSSYSFSGVIQDSIGSTTGKVALVVGNGSTSMTQTLSGENTYSLGTSIKNGAVLNVHSSSALGAGDGTSTTGLTIDNGGTLRLHGGINIANERTTLSGDGLSGGGGDGAIVNVSGDNTFGGQLLFGNVVTGTRINSESGTLNLSNTGAVSVANGRSLYLGGAGDGILAGSLDSGGSGRIYKDGAGTWTISGNNDALYGTFVNEGTLVVDGSVSANISVASGATLAGVGSAGTTLTFSDGSAFEYDFAKSGFLDAGTTATIGSGVNLNFVGVATGLSINDTITIVAAGTSLSGVFANLADGATVTSGDYEFQASYGSDNLELTVLSVIPEPTTFAMLLGLAVGMFAVTRRRS